MLWHQNHSCCHPVIINTPLHLCHKKLILATLAPGIISPSEGRPVVLRRAALLLPGRNPAYMEALSLPFLSWIYHCGFSASNAGHCFIRIEKKETGRAAFSWLRLDSCCVSPTGYFWFCTMCRKEVRIPL